jgi:hypothetical protein
VGPRLALVVWWHDTPDGRELKIVLDGSEWLVLVEGDDRAYKGGDLRHAVAEAVSGEPNAPWIVVLADQVEAAASRSLTG